RQGAAADAASETPQPAPTASRARCWTRSLRGRSALAPPDESGDQQDRTDHAGDDLGTGPARVGRGLVLHAGDTFLRLRLHVELGVQGVDGLRELLAGALDVLAD